MSTEPAEPEAPTVRSAGVARRLSGAVIQLQQDRAASWIGWFFGLMIVVIVTALFAGSFARTESVRGYVSATSGLTRLDAQASGIVGDIGVRQGDTVRRGQRLMRIQLREQTTDGFSTVSATQRSLQERKATLDREKTRLSTFLDATRGDGAEIERNFANVVTALDEQERNLKSGLAQQQDMVRRIQVNLDQGYATRDALNGQKRLALDYARQLAELRAKRAELRQETAERLRTQRLSSAERAAQLATIDNELSAVAAQLTGIGAQSRVDIVAPVDAQVAGLFVEPGASVSADQVVAILADPGAEPLIVLEVPARAVGLAKIGQEVVLKYDAFPFKTFGIARGTIVGISATPLRLPSVAAVTAGDAVPDQAALNRQATYRIEVRPEGRTVRAYGIDEPIRMGSTLTADIVVERRRLIDWVLDPIRAMRGRG